MSDIQLSAAVRQNLISLQGTAELMSRTQTRLATGKAVNSALDNPINFFTASGLDGRAREMTGLLDSMENAISIIEAADKGLGSITKMVEQMQATVRQAQNVASEDVSVVSEVMPSLDGYLAGETVGFELDLGNGAFAMDLYTFVEDDPFPDSRPLTIQDLADLINQKALEATGTSSDAQHVRAEVVGNDDQIKLTAVGGRSLTILADDTNVVHDWPASAIFGAMPTSPGVTPVDISTDDFVVDPPASGVYSVERMALAEQFNELRSQLNDLASDASFNGVNLLREDTLSVVFNELTGSSQAGLDIKGEQVDTEWLSIAKIHTYASPDEYNPVPLEGDFQSDAGLDRSLDQLTTAVSALRALSAKLGSNLSVVEIRKGFTKELVETLQSGSAKLTLADTNEEGANMLALQTRQQLSSTALSLSSQADQNVLRLF